MLQIYMKIFYNGKNDHAVHVVRYDNFTYVHNLASCWQCRCVTYLTLQDGSWSPLLVRSLPLYYCCIKSLIYSVFQIWGPQTGRNVSIIPISCLEINGKHKLITITQASLSLHTDWSYKENDKLRRERDM
jgi:hypothetical protein